MQEFLIRCALNPANKSVAILLIWALALSRTRSWAIAFAVTNLLGAFLICLFTTDPMLAGSKVRLLVCALFAFYVAIVLVNYALLCQSKKRRGHWTTAALWTPILMLGLLKYVPAIDHINAPALGHELDLPLVLVGLSFLSFRLTYLVAEVSGEAVDLPSVWNYLSFAFFVPTLNVGPISPYKQFGESLRAVDRTKLPLGVSWQRFLVGLVKFTVFGAILGKFGYRGLILDGHPHAKIDFVIALLCYPVYLFCNFSGFCDMAVGISGVVGISVAENFDRPFAARNFQELWNRWHMTLTRFLREMMFTPLVKVLGRWFDRKQVVHDIAIAIMAVFVVIGLWHGATTNFIIFGLLNGLGVVFVHYGTHVLKRRLGAAGFKKYRESRPIYWAACGFTYLYFAFTLAFFANSMADLRSIVDLAQGKVVHVHTLTIQ